MRKTTKICTTSAQAPEVCLDVADEIQGSSSHSLGNRTTSLSHQDLKVLIDKREEVHQKKHTVMGNLRQQRKHVIKEYLETLEERKLAARKALATAAVVTTTCAVALTFQIPKAAAAAAIFLTFLQFLLQLIEGIFRDHRKKLELKIEMLTADLSSTIFDEIEAFVEKLKSQEENGDFTLMTKDGFQEIMKNLENFPRILEELGQPTG